MTFGYYNKEEQKVVIELPMNLIAFAQENHSTFPLCIKDIDAAGEFLAKHIWKYRENLNTGDTPISLLIDNIFEMAYAIGKEWIEKD